VRSPEGLNESDCASLKKPFPVPHRLSQLLIKRRTTRHFTACL
jgi:hypothetical protein